MATELGGRQPFSISPPHVTMLVVCVVLIYFVIGFYGKSLDSYRMNQRVAAVRQEIAALEATNRDLQARVAYLNTEAYVEMTAREKLNLARPGDRSLVMIPARNGPIGPPGPPTGQRPAARVPEVGYLPEWVALFFGPRDRVPS
jgi:cell division protein FtsL